MEYIHHVYNIHILHTHTYIRVCVYGICQSGLQASIWLVQQWQSLDSKTKNPIVLHCTQLDISTGFRSVLESKEVGSNTSERMPQHQGGYAWQETRGGQAGRQKASFIHGFVKVANKKYDPDLSWVFLPQMIKFRSPQRHVRLLGFS